MKPLCKIRFLMVSAVLIAGTDFAHADGITTDTVSSDSYFNTAMGTFSQGNLSSGESNTAAGDSSLWANASGSYNSAFGAWALQANTTGSGNVAVGYQALNESEVANSSTAVGNQALMQSNALNNTAVGYHAMYSNKSGANNTAIGYTAGFDATGSNNIYIGASTAGTSGESNRIQIGVEGAQTKTTVAGIYNTPVTGLAVYVNSAGQLGTASSSERFKTDVASMKGASEKLAQLRPVTFRYKSDPQSTLQYGLIAEEVAKVYPELVVRGADGRIDGVRYDQLTPMLLNVVQLQQANLTAQSERLAAQARDIAEMKQQYGQLQTQARQWQNVQRQLAILNGSLPSPNTLIAQR
jgi:hypothetical protein